MRLWLVPGLRVFAVSLALHGGALSAGELTAEETIEAVKAADLSVRTIEATFRTYSASIKGPGALVGPDGLGLFSEYQWGWERDSGRQYLRGHWAAELEGRYHYSAAWFAYDGQKLRTFGPDRNTGQIRELGPHFRNWRNPLEFVGFEISFLPPRSLPELLAGARLVSTPGAPAATVVLTNDFKEGEEDLRLTAWIDTERGFRPSRMEIYRKLTNTLHRQYESRLIQEVSRGVWLTIQGVETFYYISNFQFPPGMTEAEFVALGEENKERALALLPQMSFQTKPIGFAPMTYVLDTNTVRINHQIPDEKFTFDFPPYALVWDDFEQRGYRVGGDIPTAAPSRGIGTYVVLANLIVAVTIVAAIFMIRRMRRKLSSS